MKAEQTKYESVTGWEKCAVRPGLELRTPCLQGECSTDWAIRLPDTLSPQCWLSPNRDIHPHKFEICLRISEVNFHCKASNQASMHGPLLGAKCRRVRKMCSQTGARTRDPPAYRASALPTELSGCLTLSPQWWLSPNRDKSITLIL